MSTARNPDAPSRRSRRGGRRAWMHVLDVLVVGLIVLIAYVAVVGIPEWLVKRWLTPSAGQVYAVEVSRLRFSVLSGFIADDVRVFPRKRIGPALMEARRVEVQASLFAAMLGRPFLRGAVIQKGVLRPKMVAHADPTDPKPMRVQLQKFRLVMQDVDLQGMWVTAFEAALSGSGEVWTLDDVYASLQHGADALEIHGRLAIDASGMLGGEGSAEGVPSVLIPIFDAIPCRIASRIVGDLEFPEAAPRGEWSFRINRRDVHDAELRLKVWMENPIYRGVEGLQADCDVRLTWDAGLFTAEIRPLLVVREEGSGRGGFSISGRKNAYVLEFDAVSGLDPVASAQLIGIWTNQVRNQFRFAPPYKLSGKGTVPLRHARDAHVDATLSFGMLGTGAHDFHDCAFHLRLAERTNVLDDLRATWFGGSMEGRSEWRPDANNPSNTQFRMAMNVKEVDFEKLALRVLANTSESFSGRLSGNISVEGLAGKTHRDTLRGGGDVTITKGHLFRLPIFGGLSDYLARTIPGMNMLMGQSDLRSDFTMERGRIASEKILVEGDVLSLLGQGDCGFDGSLDYYVQLTFLKSHTLMGKLVRVPTYVFSKLFEFRLRGTRADPKWYPINFSKDLWQNITGERKKDPVVPLEGEVPAEWETKW